ncbi:MAG: hypothetical protein ACYDEJ_15530 [Desulfitobacteriaceae bacterium]
MSKTCGYVPLDDSCGDGNKNIFWLMGSLDISGFDKVFVLFGVSGV